MSYYIAVCECREGHSAEAEHIRTQDVGAARDPSSVRSKAVDSSLVRLESQRSALKYVCVSRSIGGFLYRM